MTDAHLRDKNGTRYATAEAAQRANARIEAREAELAKEAVSKREKLEKRLEAKFIQAGGTAEEFGTVKDDLVRDALKAAAMQSGDDTARATFARNYQ